MKIEDLNATPYAVNRAGEIRIVGEAGQQDGFLWYWTGDRNIVAIPDGRFESDGQQGRIMRGSEIVAYLAPVADTPEIADLNAAMEEWHWMRSQLAEEYHADFLDDQFEMARNRIAAKK